MKCYLILRQNVETGPYSLEEITNRQLLPTDLIWVEGSSRSWRFPAEIRELAHLVQASAPAEYLKGKTDVLGKEESLKKVFVSLPQPQKENKTFEAITDDALITSFQQPLDALKADYQRHLQKKEKQFTRTTKALWLAAVVTGLVASTFLLQQIISNGNENGMNLAGAAVPIRMHPQNGQQQSYASYRNALTTEMVPVDTVAEKPKEVKKKVPLKKLVTLTASEFRRGVFGGINDLELKVKNSSDQILDKVTIEVAYLKPKGEVIKKENFTLKAVAPKSTKNLVIPPSKRGVDIRYRITNIQSHDAQLDQREL